MTELQYLEKIDAAHRAWKGAQSRWAKKFWRTTLKRLQRNKKYLYNPA